jgi:phage shock protein PspC (stress-responsive transcriptional regulator)
MNKRANTKLLSRGDTFLGVSEGLGEELRVPPVIFRLVFVGLLFWNWQFALISYVTTAAVLYLIRGLLPDYRVISQQAAPAASAQNDLAPASQAIAA